MEIGKQIKKYRKEMNLSQDELAKKIFVSRQTISNWENNKNYPDIKSLLLLSSFYDVSLDILIKGDIDEMKEKIKTEDINKFKHDSNIFALLLVLTILVPIPLMKFMGIAGILIFIAICIVEIYYAFRIEKYKKNFNIQTYKEILAFLEGRNINEVEKYQEYGKRPYQKIFLAISSGVLAIIVSAIMMYLL